MNFSGVKEIYAKPNDDGTFYVRVTMECADQEHSLGKRKYKIHSNCISEFPRAEIEIVALVSNNDGELLRFTASEQKNNLVW